MLLDSDSETSMLHLQICRKLKEKKDKALKTREEGLTVLTLFDSEVFDWKIRVLVHANRNYFLLEAG